MKTRSKSAKEKSLKPLSEVPTNKAVKFVDEKTKLAPEKSSKSVTENTKGAKKRSRSQTSSAANNASQSTAGTLPVEQIPANANQRTRSSRKIQLNKVDELPEVTETERSQYRTKKAEKADKAESVGELEDGSGVSIKIVYANEFMRPFRSGNRLESNDYDVQYVELFEYRCLRYDLERTDEEYRSWLKQWTERQKTTREFFERSKSQSWQNFQAFYKKMKSNVFQVRNYV